MKEFIFGFDDNLGLPEHFATEMQVKLKSYHDIGNMLRDFENNQLDLIFTPAGTLPYLKADYKIIAQASFGPDRVNHILSKLVTAKDIQLENIHQATLGRVNPFCTTSFWCPLIALKDKFPQGTHFNFIDTDGFDDMLLKTAEKKIDAAMVWDAVLKKNPASANKVHSLAVKEDLPTPVIITKLNLPDELINKLTHLKDNKQKYFNGFIAPNLTMVEKFIADMKAVNTQFKLGI